MTTASRMPETEAEMVLYVRRKLEPLRGDDGIYPMKDATLDMIVRMAFLAGAGAGYAGKQTVIDRNWEGT